MNWNCARLLPILLLVLTSSDLDSSAAEVSAFIEPYRDIDVASSEMGSLVFLNVKEGDRVTRGQVLGGLDESVLQAALEVAKKAKDSRGRLNSAQAELSLQVDRFEKISQLMQRRHASPEELARAEAQLQVAQAQVLGVQEELDVKAAECDRIEAQLKQKRIVSPIDGVVTRIFKDAGEFLSASDPIVVKVVQLDVLLVEFPVPALAARDFKAGQTVPLRTASAETPVSGTIEYVSPTTDAQSNTTRVRVRIENRNMQCHSGDACWLTVASVAGESPAERPSGFFTKSQSKQRIQAQ